MKKYISMLLLAAMASAAMAQEPQQIDSITVKHSDVVREVEYYEYHPNGKVAKQWTKRLDNEGNWIETARTEWTEDYPQKGSSMSEYGYDTLEVYGVTHKIVLLDDYESSYCEYYGDSKALKPFERVSATLDANHRVLSKAFYKYDEQGNEALEDSLAYTYDNLGRLVHEHYFLGDENGQPIDLGSFDTTYDQVVETPSGPGKMTTILSMDVMLRRDSIKSDDGKYQYYAAYTSIDGVEWEKREERITYDSEVSKVETQIKFADHAVTSGKKTEYKSESTKSGMTVKVREYSCTTDTTQWLLLSQLDDYYFYDIVDDGCVNVSRQSFYTNADENGNLHSAYDVLIFNEKLWTDKHTCLESIYYEGEQESTVFKTYYYHNPDITSITYIKDQPTNGVMFDLSGRRINGEQRGSLMIRGGKKLMMK